MRILVVTAIPPQTQPTNAVGLVSHTLLTGLLAHHQLTLVTLVGPDAEEVAALEQLRAAGVDVQAVPSSIRPGRQSWRRRWQLVSGMLGGRHPFRTVWFYDPAVQARLDRLLADNTFDVVQLEDNAVGLYRYATRCPLVLTEYEVRRPRPIDWNGLRLSNWRRWLWDEVDWQRWPGYQRAVWSRAQRLQVFTPRDAVAVQAQTPALAGRLRINPFGLPLPPLPDPAREEPLTLVFTGGFTHRPNVDGALWVGRELMPALRERCPGVRLMLVGSYPTHDVQALAGADIEVTGRVPAVEPYLERAAVILAPVRIGGGMRMKVLQGMALGKAVVTTPLGAEGLGQMNVPPPLALAEDAAELVAATAGLLADPAARRRLGAQARAFVAEHFSADAFARRTEAVYAELVQPEAQLA